MCREESFYCLGTARCLGAARSGVNNTPEASCFDTRWLVNYIVAVARRVCCGVVRSASLEERERVLVRLSARTVIHYGQIQMIVAGGCCTSQRGVLDTKFSNDESSNFSETSDIGTHKQELHELSKHQIPH